MRQSYAALYFLLGCVLTPLPASSQLPGAGSPLRSAPFTLTADEVEYESGRDIYTASGNVRIQQKEKRLSADWVSFSNRTQRGVASGNVFFTDGVDEVHAEFFEFDVQTLQGVLYDARFAGGRDQLRVEGARIAKTGERTYDVEQGTFTTCDCPDPDAREPWRIEADSTQLEVGGYGTARNSTFRVFDVPVVFLPWMMYPIKTDRETGFLLPELGHNSRSGFEVALPFFWAPVDQLGATLKEHWFSKRGFKTDVDVEALPGERSSARLYGTYIHDQKIDPHTPPDPYSNDRWGVDSDQDWYLPGGWRLRSHAVYFSDNDQPNDFEDFRAYRSDRFLESSAFAFRSFGDDGRMPFVAGAALADDLQSPDTADRDPYLLQRIPDVDFALLPTPLPGPIRWLSALVPSLGFEYTLFENRRSPTSNLPTATVVGDHLFLDTGIDSLPDAKERGPQGMPQCGGLVPCTLDLNQDDFATNGGPENDGVFEEGEPLADRGSRVRLHPRLALPFRIADAVEAYPEVGWYQTLYGTAHQGYADRGLLTGRVDLRTRFVRSLGHGATHIFEPRLGYAYIGYQGQGGNPLFVPPTAIPQKRLRQFDLENVVLDPADRIHEFNGITLGFGNRVFGRSPLGGIERLLADVDFSWGYDFASEGAGDLYLDGRVYPTALSTLHFSLGFDPDQTRVDEGLLDMTFETYAGHSLALGYRYLRDAPAVFEAFPYENSRFNGYDGNLKHVQQVDARGTIVLTRQWSLRGRAVYSFDRSFLAEVGGGIRYVSPCGCWEVGIDASGGPSQGTQVGVVYRLTGLGLPSGGSRRTLDQLLFVPGLLDALSGV